MMVVKMKMEVIYSVYESSRAGTRQDVLSFRVEGEESTSRNLNLKHQCVGSRLVNRLFTSRFF